MRISLANYAIEDLLQDFRQNLTLLNEIMYAIAIVKGPVAKTYKQNSFKQPIRKLRTQKYKGIQMRNIHKGVRVSC